MSKTGRPVIDLGSLKFPPPSGNWPSLKAIIQNEWLQVVDRDPTHEDNYWFGSALHHHKHPDARKYHKLGQTQKTRYREQFERRAKSTHPHMKKYGEIWRSYCAMAVAARLGD